MQIVIDIDENVFTRLFDNGTEDYTIVNDDLFAIAKAIREGVSISEFLEELICDRISNSINEYKAESEDK